MADFIEQWLEFLDGVPSPPLFKLWSGITCLGGALERRVWVETAKSVVFPNLYTMLVGPPGSGKTQAISRVNELWGEQKLLHIAPDSMTSASMNDVLSESLRTCIDPKTLRPQTEYCALLVGADEFVVFCPAHDMEFLGRLTKIFDNPPSLRVRRKYLKEEVNITRPYLTMLTGAQPGVLRSIFPDEAWSGGFTSRQIMIYEGSSPTPDIFASVPERDELRPSLREHLTQCASLFGKFYIDSEAGNRLNVWWKSGAHPKPQHPKLEYYCARRAFHILKLALIASASRDPQEMKITPEDMDRAFMWIFEAEDAMPDIFRAMTGRSDVDVINDLHQTMFALYAKRKSKPIERSWLISFLANRVPHEKVLRIIEIAEAGRWITQDQHLPGFYRPVPKHLNELD